MRFTVWHLMTLVLAVALAIAWLRSLDFSNGQMLAWLATMGTLFALACIIVHDCDDDQAGKP